MTYRCQEIGDSQLGFDFNSSTSVILSLCLYERKTLSLSAVVAFLFTASSTLKRGKKRYYGKVRCQGVQGCQFFCKRFFSYCCSFRSSTLSSQFVPSVSIKEIVKTKGIKRSENVGPGRRDNVLGLFACGDWNWAQGLMCSRQELYPWHCRFDFYGPTPSPMSPSWRCNFPS